MSSIATVPVINVANMSIEEDDNLINEVYSTFSEIESELKIRRENKDLVKKVESFLGRYLIAELKLGPRAVISRTIINPNRELEYFIDLANDLKFIPLGLEYHDKFVARNPDKYHLAKMYFAKRRTDGTQFLSSVRVVNFNKYEGKKIDKVKTLSGESLINFHHNLLFQKFPNMVGNITDINKWFNETKNISQFYYLHFLSLFICHGVLFENYILKDKDEYNFFIEKILPSFREAKRIFGVKPLIFPLLPIEHERSSSWLAYSWDLKVMIERKLKDGIIKKWITTCLRTLNIVE